ncbi:ATP-binding protein [Streptomyces sp. NBC_00414]|uniref:ATP-binding protein n=1 Tax=Streptomyces sp. NBC_00414 TaxID=2975739 RepID=UPI002E1F5A0E
MLDVRAGEPGHDLPKDFADHAPTAELLASEPLTNAHLHTRGPYALRVRSAEPDRLRIAVWDSDCEIPAAFNAGGAAAATTRNRRDGRGLHLVQACADSRGAHVLGTVRGGKLLWAGCGHATAGR